jgi:hypothetical protein
MLLAALILTPPTLALAYAIAEQLGWMDRLTGRKAAIDGLKRMRAATGFPHAWIFDDESDKREFVALEQRISRKMQVDKIKKVLAEDVRPSCILIGGDPIALTGIPAEWPLEYRRVYLPEHSVMYMFGVTRSGGKGTSDRVCTVGELEKWLAEEKDARRYKVGGLSIGLISLAFLLIRFGAAG